MSLFVAIRRCCFALLVCLFWPLLLFPQPMNPLFQRLSTDQGLSNVLTQDILQDRQGYIWVATTNGLNKFDGYSFTSYKQIPGDTTSLARNHIRALFETSDGSLWVGTSEGLSRLRVAADGGGYAREQFESFFHDPQDPRSLIANDIRCFAQDKEGNLWIGTGSGISVLEEPALGRRPLRFRNYSSAELAVGGEPVRRVTCLLPDSRGNMWIATLGSGLICKPAGEEVFQSYSANAGDPVALSSNFIVMLYEDNRGALWIGTYGGGLNRLSPETGHFQVFQPQEDDPQSISSNKVYDIVEHEGGYWIATLGDGLNYFDPQSHTFTRYTYLDYDVQSLSNNFVRRLLLDRSENLWLATNRGLSRLDLKPQKFRHYQHDARNINSLSHDYTLTILEDRHGFLWVGNNAGVDRIDPDGNFRHYEVLHNNPRSRDGYVYTICEDSQGRLWLGSFGGGLFRYDHNRDRFIQLPGDADTPGQLSDSRVYTLFEDSRDNLWISTVSGLSRMLPDGSITATWWEGDGERPEIAAVGTLFEEQTGIIWLGSIDGLIRLDTDKQRIDKYQHDTGNDESLSNNVVSSIVQTGDQLWCATQNGLSVLDLSQTRDGIPLNRFQRYFERDGLADNAVSSILPDAAGHLWISTSNGISFFDTGTRLFRNYDRRDGLQGNEFVQNSCFRSRSGELFFGGVHGLNRFDPAQVKTNPHQPAVVLTSFKRADKVELQGRALEQSRRISLTHEDRLFSFEFAALDYTNPEKNRYAYTLEGFDDGWIDAGNRRYATYTNLDAGEYVFRVKASNNDGRWSEQGAFIAVSMAPPYWGTWWFRLLGLLAVVGLMALLYRYRVMKLLEIERVRVRIASDLHDDVGSSLTKISLYSDLIRSGMDEAERSRLLEQIGSRSRELVVTMSDIVWSIDARNDSTEDLLDRMRDFATSLFAASDMDYSFDTANNNLQRKLPSHIRQNIYLIFKEAVNNAARHSGAGKISIHFSSDSQFIRMEICDDGSGFSPEGRRGGYGLQNMAMRAKRIGGNLTVDSSKGTRITLQVKNVK